MTLSCTLRAIGITLALIVASCASNELQGARDGSSLESAIILDGVSNEIEGVRAEHAEIKKRFPGWQWESQGLLPPTNGRHYDAISLSKGAETKTVYFDITGWFGKL